jgi:hypothetical protein
VLMFGCGSRVAQLLGHNDTVVATLQLQMNLSAITASNDSVWAAADGQTGGSVEAGE